MKKAIYAFMSLIMAAAVLTGCGSSGYEDSTYSNEKAATVEDQSYSTDDVYTEESYDEAGSAAAETVTDSASVTEEKAAESVTDNRKLIKNVSLSVETQEFDKLTAKIEERVDELGGYIENSNVYGNSLYDSSTRSADYTVRVPVTKLDQFVSQVSEISNVTSKNISTTDVTLSYVDTKSRKEALEVEQERLMEILKQADTIDTIVALESRLTEVRYEIQNLESQLRTYDNLVDYATISIHVSEVELYTPDTTVEKSDFERMTEGFIHSIKSVGNGLKNFVIALVIALPYLLVWAVVIFVIVFIIRKMIKGKKNKAEKRKLKIKEEQEKSKIKEEQTEKTGEEL